MPASALNSVTAQYISSVPERPISRTSPPASMTALDTASANSGEVWRASLPITTDFALKCCAMARPIL